MGCTKLGDLADRQQCAFELALLDHRGDAGLRPQYADAPRLASPEFARHYRLSLHYLLEPARLRSFDFPILTKAHIPQFHKLYHDIHGLYEIDNVPGSAPPARQRRAARSAILQQDSRRATLLRPRLQV